MHTLKLLSCASHGHLAQEIARRLPTTVGCTPQQATTSEALLLAARRLKPDLVALNTKLLDGADGLEVCRHLKNEQPWLRVVVISPQQDPEIMNRAVHEAKADWYLRQNTLSFDELIWIAKQSLLSRLHREGMLVEERYRFLTQSDAARQALEKVDAILPGQNTLICGETGTGKELIARRVHANARAFEPKRPFRVLDCSSLSPQLFESEVFGHRKGAFTGAATDRVGALQLVNGGDLFLDEIHNIPIHLQQKLLRALNDGAFSPVGSNEEIRSSFRVIAATNLPVDEAIASGKLLPDFVERVRKIKIEIPPLRERPEDISLLIEAHLERISFDKEFSPDATQYLSSLSWPGNIRELKSSVDMIIAETKVPVISVAHLIRFFKKSISKPNTTPLLAPADFLSSAIENMIEENQPIHELTQRIESLYFSKLIQRHGSIRAAARSLGLPNSTFQRRLQRLELSHANQ